MNSTELNKIIELHGKWVRGDIGGVKADLRSADLTSANLRSADLTSADLRSANLTFANLTSADLTSANLRSADLTSANLTFANLTSADLTSANLRSADLRSADLTSADLTSANLRSADLRSADLRSANLTFANLRSADLTSADLRSANLSGSTGIPSASEFLSKFEKDERGILVYKRIGHTIHGPPAHWTIKSRAVLTEVPNPDRATECGCGINFGTKDWCMQHFTASQLWLCLIKWADLADVVVPFNTDGKARCARLTLLKKLPG